MHEVLFEGGARRPLGKIVAVGRNYADHAAEMKAAAEPVIFTKPPTAVRLPGDAIALPRDRGSIHHEIEITAWLGEGGRDLTPEAAGRLVAGYGLGLDLTLRDVQARAKEKGQPWTLAKGFDGSLPLGAFLPPDRVGDPRDLRFTLHVNDAVRQRGAARDMLLGVPELLAYISSWITLEPGDVLLTGTPAGVGPLVPGDRARLVLEGLQETEFRFV